MLDPFNLAVIFSTFLLAGTVKGIIGLGLPTISLAVLTVIFDLATAMALLIIPSLLTNVWQALQGNNLLPLCRRLGLFLCLAFAFVWLGAIALTRVDLSLLSALLGVLLIAYAIVGFRGLNISIGPKQQMWAGPLLGAINGILTGMTGSFVVPGVMYLQAIGLPRDMLIQAMGLLFTLSTIALALALGGQNLIGFELGLLSALGVIPALVGMVIGQGLRQRISEPRFRRMFFVVLFALGAYVCINAFGKTIA